MAFPYAYHDKVAVKHAIEAQGVPHTEVELILVNGCSVDFYHLMTEGEYVTVYPPFSSLDISMYEALRPPLPKPARFVIDNHLGKLARRLRLLGFDCLYDPDLDDQALAKISSEQERILLTRDRGLLMRKEVVYGCCLQSRDPSRQLMDVFHRFQLRNHIRAWQRCIRCNGDLLPVDKKDVVNRLEPKTKKYYDQFHICQNCAQIYWQGSHFPHLERIVNEAGREDERKPR